jgi:hypothetical protein
MSRDPSSHRLTVGENLDHGIRESLHFDDFVFLRETWARGENHSERSACITSTRAARAAGSIEATTAAANSTNAETITCNAPARTPIAAITTPSATTPLSIFSGCDPSAMRVPNSRVRALTENASTPATNNGNQQRDPCEHAKDQGVQAVERPDRNSTNRPRNFPSSAL